MVVLFLALWSISILIYIVCKPAYTLTNSIYGFFFSSILTSIYHYLLSFIIGILIVLRWNLKIVLYFLVVNDVSVMHVCMIVLLVCACLLGSWGNQIRASDPLQLVIGDYESPGLDAGSQLGFSQRAICSDHHWTVSATHSDCFYDPISYHAKLISCTLGFMLVWWLLETACHLENLFNNSLPLHH